MMRDDDDEIDEEEAARPPAPHEQTFESKIEEDLGYEIEDDFIKEQIAEDVYNPKPMAEFGFDSTVAAADTTAATAPLAAPAAYASNKGAFAEAEEADPFRIAAPTNLVASSKGYVMPKQMSHGTAEEADAEVDHKFGVAIPQDDDGGGHTPLQPLDTVEEGAEGGTKPSRRGPSSVKDRIKVAVRFRPMSEAEMVSKSKKKKEGGPEAFVGWDTEDDGELDVMMQKGVRGKVEGKNMFHVDRVYEEQDYTEALYSDICKPIMDAVVSGRHGTIFGYGATGAGKSFTIQGGKGLNGIIQLASKDLFDLISDDQGREYTVKASYFEIYNEQVRDLMGQDEEDNPKSRRATAVVTTVNKLNIELPILNIKEDKGGDVVVNAQSTPVSNLENIIRVLHKGNRNRATEKTETNKFSSRSHAIFRLTVESHEFMDEGADMVEGGMLLRVASLNFVDLAGSENSARASTTGIRKREGGKINQSLLSLSQVIHQLSLQKKKAHINYRDSKLTRLLQPHLAGNAAIAIICCVTPAKKCLEETRQTMKFAYNARRIKLKPKVNEVIDDKVLIENLKKELHDTRVKYQDLQEFVKNNPPGSGGGKSEFPMIDAFIAQMSASVKTIDFEDAIEELSAISGGGGRRSSGDGARRASADGARRASREAVAAAVVGEAEPASDDDGVDTDDADGVDTEDDAPAADSDPAAEEDEDDVDAFRRMILAKFMEDTEEGSEVYDDEDDNADTTMNETTFDGVETSDGETTDYDTSVNRTNTEDSLVADANSSADSEKPKEEPIASEAPNKEDRNVNEVFRSMPDPEKEAGAGLLPLVDISAKSLGKKAEPKRTFLDDDDSSAMRHEAPDEYDLNLIEKFRSEILEKFRDEIVDEEAADELDENAQNVAVIANELITKFKKEIVYKYKNEFPEIQAKRVEVDLSATRVGDSGIVGRVVERGAAGQGSSDDLLNTTDESSASSSSVELFEDEFDETGKMGDGSKPQHRSAVRRRADSTQTDRAVVNGHGAGANGKVISRMDTDSSALPIESSLGMGTSGSVSSDLSSDVADRDKGSSNMSPEPANPPGEEDDGSDYVIPPGEIAVGRGLEGANMDKKVRIKFLEEKLEATDELVETLFVELENAKAFIRELVFENAAGGGSGIDQSGAALFGAAGTSGVTVVDEQILNQCEILKFGIYTSLLFFVFGQHELFLATVFFLWLSLEVATKA